jgi:deazaflavin-dependent oxidoreductase (nitroreductase family)
MVTSLAAVWHAGGVSDLDNPIDPPGGWQRQHTEEYVASNGANGHHWRGTTTLLLTTLGRRSGKARRTPLIYGRDGDRYLVVASKGGSAHHPEWYLNLSTNPRVRLQIGADVFDAEARTATPDEKARLWPIVTERWPAYDDYQANTERDIPLVIITRV